MGKKSFLENWKGPRVGTDRLTWKRVEGKSLTKEEEESLRSGLAVFHKKAASRTKIFVNDEEGSRYAVTIDDLFLPIIKVELCNAGYITP